jgi:hypothetical protein
LAWCSLVYIPCELHYSQKQYNEFDTNTKQYRIFQLDKAGLARFFAAQQPGVIDAVYLQLGDKVKYVNLRIFISLYPQQQSSW